MSDTSFSPDRIFAALELAREKLIQSLEAKLKADRGYEMSQGIAYSSARKAGSSIDDAKQLAKANEKVQEFADALDRAISQHLSAKIAYENLVILSELRRTQESSMRGMRL